MYPFNQSNPSNSSLFDEHIAYCLSNHIPITADMILRYITNASRWHYIINSNRVDNEDLKFKQIIDFVPDMMFGSAIIKAAIQSSNIYYLKTILATQRYWPDSAILLNAITSDSVSQEVIDLLMQYKFETWPIVMYIVRPHDHISLSRYIVAGGDLTNRQSQILAYFMSQHFKSQIASRGNVLQILIDYLKSHRHSIVHYMMMKYLMCESSLIVSDIATGIWDHYVYITIGYIDAYHGMLK